MEQNLLTQTEDISLNTVERYQKEGYLDVSNVLNAGLFPLV